MSRQPNSMRAAMSRRQLLARLTAACGAAGLADSLAAFEPDQPDGAEADESEMAALKRELLGKLVYSAQDIEDWLAGKAFPFGKYDPELGYLHLDRDFQEGIDGTVCSYRYDRLGARRMFAHAEQPCRINTYGDSFTSCEQVSDGETWQEVLAAHLGEPVRNYGIGGYSVYQAYLRMLREERRAPAPYIVFNIFDDDHYRNLHGWQRLRFGVNRKSANPPVPYVTVDPDSDRFEEHANLCDKPERLALLCHVDSATMLLGDDFVLNVRADREAKRRAGEAVPASDFDDAAYTRAALYATRRIVEKVHEFAAANGRKVLYVLSYNPQTIRRSIEGRERFDRGLVDFLESRQLPYVDLLAAHTADHASFAGGVDAYLKKYFIGHYNPLGNFFCAFALKDKLVAMLDPKPPAYRVDSR
ncbi:MAG: hypothetical protein WD278_10555 [Pirellulales bacterium]